MKMISYTPHSFVILIFLNITDSFFSFTTHHFCQSKFICSEQCLQDYHDDIRQEQMWEMQALSSTQNQNLDTTNSNSSSPENGIVSETDSATECSGGMMCNESGSDLNLNNNSHLVHNSEGNGSGMHLDLSHATNLLGSGNSLIPTTGISSVSGMAPCPTAMQNDVEKETVYVDANGGILHPALRGIKAVNIGEWFFFVVCI